MGLTTAWAKWMKKWRVDRAQRAIAVPDPADCGTAWGMELSLPKEPKAHRRKRSAGT